MNKEKVKRYFLISLLDEFGTNPILDGYIDTSYPNFNEVVDKINGENSTKGDYCITNIIEVTKEDYNNFWFDDIKGKK